MLISIAGLRDEVFSLGPLTCEAMVLCSEVRCDVILFFDGCVKDE